ncbi:MAG: hypothetical protein AB8B72_07275 [Crocinitomicaceae bacterium]
MENSGPKINLKQHQRFRRQFPWGLIRKLVIVATMIGLFYYLMNTISDSKKPDNNPDSYEIEVEVT